MAAAEVNISELVDKVTDRMVDLLLSCLCIRSSRPEDLGEAPMMAHAPPRPIEVFGLHFTNVGIARRWKNAMVITIAYVLLHLLLAIVDFNRSTVVSLVLNLLVLWCIFEGARGNHKSIMLLYASCNFCQACIAGSYILLVIGFIAGIHAVCRLDESSTACAGSDDDHGMDEDVKNTRAFMGLVFLIVTLCCSCICHACAGLQGSYLRGQLSSGVALSTSVSARTAATTVQPSQSSVPGADARRAPLVV
eukprot:gnl/TRDRNA2_/TRDRNA2_166620_c0_seq1.p1 gnl/TRDRNA2_/TRDRNA2_166620_c0~~gnl/TRDRNA2_/TRDRNA2_166620_c0_seq1.p1  ORF type:complete len:249 (-),score=22.32 gnl/TRDRNA2_/TRDRNA2_166620_c0_seq1:310-1056(-)